MPDLFPTEDIQVEEQGVLSSSASEIAFGKSWRFDHEQGEFIMTPTGNVSEVLGADAWAEWCKKALATARGRFLVYSRDYGQDYEELIGNAYSRSAIESEIVRMTQEALLADPRTNTVDDFTFSWTDGICSFTCTITNVRGEVSTINESVVIN